MENKAKLIVDGKTYEYPIMVGTEGEKAIDISKLRSDTGCITFDNGFGNTGSCTSAITYLDGEQGILRYRGYPIEQVAEKSTFVETSYLLIYGDLPKQKELNDFSQSFTKHASLHPDMLNFFAGYPSSAHPMCVLSAMVCSLSGYHPELLKPEPTPEEVR